MSLITNYFFFFRDCVDTRWYIHTREMQSIDFALQINDKIDIFCCYFYILPFESKSCIWLTSSVFVLFLFSLMDLFYFIFFFQITQFVATKKSSGQFSVGAYINNGSFTWRKKTWTTRKIVCIKTRTNEYESINKWKITISIATCSQSGRLVSMGTGGDWKSKSWK